MLVTITELVSLYFVADMSTRGNGRTDAVVVVVHGGVLDGHV